MLLTLFKNRHSRAYNSQSQLARCKQRALSLPAQTGWKMRAVVSFGNRKGRPVAVWSLGLQALKPQCTTRAMTEGARRAAPCHREVPTPPFVLPCEARSQ